VITLDHVYWAMGLLLAGVAVENWRDRSNPRRVDNALFWGLYAITFLAGSRLPHFASGCLVIGMALVASIGKLGQGTRESQTVAQREASSMRLGNRLFVPALTIPAVTLLGTFTLKRAVVGGVALVDPAQITLISLGLATVVALIVGMIMLRPPPLAPLEEGRRLFDAVGWAAVLPQMLATLGQLFVAAGVGKQVGRIIKDVLPDGSLFWGVVVYCVGMALFTIVMGNAFAAFPIMTAAIGYPVLVQQFHGNAAAVFAIGMLAGFCGTLCTPMAANFNIVPAALLEMKDKYGPIKAQIPTAIPLLACNVALMYVLAF
jgi:uncharacterized membrane protein